MSQVEALRRHDWVHLADDWRQQSPTPLSREDWRLLDSWTARRRPLIMARRRDGDAPDLLRLGLALPGKKRLCVAVSLSAVVLRRPPPLLLEVIQTAEKLWPEAMRDLTGMIVRAAPDARAFGSLAWQYFADDPAYSYVTPDSDIDLLLAPASGGQLAGWINLLRDFENRWPAPRLDGEIALPHGDFIAWREFAAQPKRILIKGADSLRLRPIEDIDSLLGARAA